MNKIKKVTGRFLSLILAAAMCVSLVPVSNVTAFAADKYTVTLEDCENGSLSFDGYAGQTHRFAEGEEVTVNIEPEEGYELYSFMLILGSGMKVDLTESVDHVVCVFAMPDTGVTVNTEFRETEDAAGNTMPYASVGDTDYISHGNGGSAIGYTYNHSSVFHPKYTYVRSGNTSEILVCVQANDSFEEGVATLYDASNQIGETKVSRIAIGMSYIEENYSGTYTDNQILCLEQCYVWYVLAGGAVERYVYGINESAQETIFSDAYSYAREHKAEYLSYGEWWSMNGQDVAYFWCEPNSGYLTLKKTSANTSITDGNNCYSLEGAEYKVYTDKDCTERARDVDGKRVTLTTDENGNTEAVEMEQGTYYVKETTASPGYLLCDGDDACSYSENGVHEVTVTTADTEDNPATVECEETPGNDPAGISLYKIDADTGEQVPEGAASLAGAQFTVKYYDGYYDENTLPDEAKRTWVLETKRNAYDGTYDAYLADDYKVSGDDLYYDEFGTVTLPLGTYTVQETKAPEGYLLEGQTRPIDSSYTAPVHLGQVTLDDNTVGSLSIGNELTVGEDVIRGGVEVQKRDVESQREDPQGGGSFEGITLEITNESGAAVMVDSDGDGVLEKFEPGEVVMTLTTDGNGYAATSSDALPYGSYTITETAVPGVTDHRMLDSEQDDGYLLGSDAGAAYKANLSIDFEIREEGVIVNLTGAETENGDSVVSAEEAITDQVKRGDITLTKHDETTQEGMSVPFRVTSLTTGESHVFWTDKNGEYSSDSTWNAHSYRTDAGETQYDGLWFYGYADGEASGVEVDDALGALPYDSYRLDELRCEANEGKELVHTTFTVDQNIRVLNLGQYYNGDAPYIHTSAWASDTGTQLCYIGGDNGDGWVTLYDDVYYYNLTPGARSLSSFVKDFSVSHVIFLIVTTKKIRT